MQYLNIIYTLSTHMYIHRFTAVRRGVISFVEASPRQQCGEGWTYDHSLVFNTITSEVPIFSFFGCESSHISRNVR